MKVFYVFPIVSSVSSSVSLKYERYAMSISCWLNHFMNLNDILQTTCKKSLWAQASRTLLGYRALENKDEMLALNNILLSQLTRGWSFAPLVPSRFLPTWGFPPFLTPFNSLDLESIFKKSWLRCKQDYNDTLLGRQPLFPRKIWANFTHTCTHSW